MLWVLITQYKFNNISGEGNGTPLQYSCLEKSHGRRSLGRLQSMGSLRVRHDWATSLSLFTFMHWRRKWEPTPVFLPGESQGWRSLVGWPSVGSHRVGHDWSDLAAAATIFIYFNNILVWDSHTKISLAIFRNIIFSTTVWTKLFHIQCFFEGQPENSTLMS